MLSLRHGDATYVIMTTFEGGDWKSASLGNVLIREAVERNIGDGVRYFDLTIGDEAYKRDFGARRMPLYSIVRPLSLAGVALAAGVKAATKLRDRRVS
jgi:CelD/BcsL family acetyltransferase involved in cellulose biosynthesis